MVSKEIRNEVITEIFKGGLDVRYNKIDKEGQELLGFYLNIPNKSYDEIKKMKQLERIFVNLKTKAQKCYGAINESDFENQISECYMYLYMALDEVFSGSANVEDELRVETVEDIYKIINDERLASKLCKYCITYVEMKMKTFIKKKSNPDYAYGSDGYTRIDYEYLDEPNEDGTDKYELLAKEEPIEEETGELSEYILSKYVCQLTNKQQLFVQSYIWFGKNSQGHIEDENGNILYIKQELRSYRMAIAKKILKMIDKDKDTLIKENEYGRMFIDWRE